MRIIMRNLPRKLKNERGFSLIELMIVIAIIALLIGVGVPAWQAVTRSGNETAAAQSISTIRQMQVQYAAKNSGEFGTFADLVDSLQLDEKFKEGDAPLINGYIYTMKVEAPSGSQPAFYSINADPQVSEGISATGERHFYFDSTLSTIKQTKENRPATPDDPKL